METLTKKYCYSCFYGLTSNSILRVLYVKDSLLDEEGFVKLFEIGNRKLSAKIDPDGKLEALIYKADYLEKVDKNKFTNESLQVITRSLNRLQIAFIGLHIRRQGGYIAATRYNHQPIIEILDYKTGSKELCLTVDIGLDTSVTISPYYRSASLKKVCEILIVSKPNVDEYIERFLSLENLSGDPVLHLITLSSLYEYINEHDKSFNSLFNTEIAGKSIEVNGKPVKLTCLEKFKCTRDLVAHGLLHGKKTLDTLKQFLGSSSNRFDRYNHAHINLINEVIGDTQTIIEKYLRDKLETEK